eukprot:TRINITY_DN80303_c0_g1_i1.p1 TRINITY_DN80303_c0_g1~~TRINITY_DN80303_c0_g1_i1.p1  ORF type:complete len:643 (+),score=117.11 TRINITY_DN80303_c0_g1_i1:172-2100(+)
MLELPDWTGLSLWTLVFTSITVVASTAFYFQSSVARLVHQVRGLVEKGVAERRIFDDGKVGVAIEGADSADSQPDTTTDTPGSVNPTLTATSKAAGSAELLPGATTETAESGDLLPDTTESEQCCVCLQPLKALSSASLELPCGHRLHKGCAQQMRRFALAPRCPICRKEHAELTTLETLVNQMVVAYLIAAAAPAERKGSPCPNLASQVLELDSCHELALFFQGQCFANGFGVLQDTAQAKELLQRGYSICHERGDGAPKFAIALGQLHLQAEDLQRAQVLLEEALSAGEGSASNLLGVICAKRDQKIEAKRFFEQGVEKEDPCAMVNLASAYYLHEGRRTEARHLLLEAYLVGNVDACAQLGDLCLAEGHFQEARAFYTEGVDRGDVNALNLIGQSYEQEGNVEEAKAYHEKARREGLAMASIHLGLLCLDERRYEAAAKFYSEAYRSPDRNAKLAAANNLGTLHELNNRLLEARLLYEEAYAGKEPKSESNLARVLVRLGQQHMEEQQAKAIEFYEAARCLNFDAEDVKYENAALINLGTLYSRIGRTAEAVELFQEGHRRGDSRATQALQVVMELDRRSSMKQVSDAVQVCGLRTSGAALNGCKGVVVAGYDEKTGRCGVKMEDGSLKAIRPENLKKL